MGQSSQNGIHYRYTPPSTPFSPLTSLPHPLLTLSPPPIQPQHPPSPFHPTTFQSSSAQPSPPMPSSSNQLPHLHPYPTHPTIKTNPTSHTPSSSPPATQDIPPSSFTQKTPLPLTQPDVNSFPSHHWRVSRISFD